MIGIIIIKEINGFSVREFAFRREIIRPINCMCIVGLVITRNFVTYYIFPRSPFWLDYFMFNWPRQNFNI